MSLLCLLLYFVFLVLRETPFNKTNKHSTVRHTYPSQVPGVEDDWFAEHMLPEGAHNHALDWTVMFLNRGRTALDEEWPKSFEEEQKSFDGEPNDDEVEGVGGAGKATAAASAGEGAGEGAEGGALKIQVRVLVLRSR